MSFRIVKMVQTEADAEILGECVDVLCHGLYTREMARFPQNEITESLVTELANVEGDKAEWLKRLRNVLRKLPVVKLTLAVHPSQQMIDTIAKWIKAQVGEETIIQVEVDAKILGGARISFGGRYFSRTVSDQI